MGPATNQAPNACPTVANPGYTGTDVVPVFVDNIAPQPIKSTVARVPTNDPCLLGGGGRGLYLCTFPAYVKLRMCITRGAAWFQSQKLLTLSWKLDQRKPLVVDRVDITVTFDEATSKPHFYCMGNWIAAAKITPPTSGVGFATEWTAQCTIPQGIVLTSLAGGDIDTKRWPEDKPPHPPPTRL